MKKISASTGIMGPILFWSACIISSLITPQYSHTSQYISELGAKGAEARFLINVFGIIPMGISMILFGLYGIKNLNVLWNKIAFGLMIISGILFGSLGVFSCDKGCSFIDMSQSAILHNQFAFISFSLFLLIVLLYLIGIGKHPLSPEFLVSLASIAVSIFALYQMIKVGIESDIKGAYQRLFLLSFHGWLIYISLLFRKNKSLVIK